MILSSALWWGIGVLILFSMLVVVSVEQRRGKRLFLTGFRTALDNILTDISDSFGKRWRHFTKYIVQLHWYYSIHSVLKGALRVIVAIYTYFEKLFERNRKKAKVLRAEKKKLKHRTHLDQIEEHRQETALTPAQQKQLKKKALDGNGW